MTLDEKISALRNQHEMSQGDLAEKMNVSCQSISKWETDTSVPELDKLIQLSEVFHITLDEFVKGDVPPAHEESENTEPEYNAPAQPVQVIVQKTVSTQKVIGFILLGIGLLCCLLALVFGSGLLIIGGYIIFCSVICLLVKKYAGLIIGWVTILLIFFLSPYVTGASMRAIFYPSFYYGDFSINHIITVALWIFAILLTVLTVREFHKNKRK